MPYTASTLTLSSNMPRVRWNGESIFFVLLLLGLLSGLWVLGYLRERAAARELGRLDDEEAVWRGLAQLFLTLCAMTALGVHWGLCFSVGVPPRSKGQRSRRKSPRPSYMGPMAPAYQAQHFNAVGPRADQQPYVMSPPLSGPGGMLV